MRNIFLLIALLNLGVWAVFSWVIQKPESAPDYDGPSITLLRALDPRAPITAPEPETGRCVSIGPFTDAVEADVSMAILIEAGFEPDRSLREVEVSDGYWVYIEQIENMAAAQALQEDLAENGIEDTQIVPNSDSGDLLSLGVFSEISRARSRGEQVSQIGYEATIADNMTTTQTYWIDVELGGDQSSALEMLQAPGRISRLELLTCTDDESV